MKSLFVRIIILAILVALFGTGIMQAINYIENMLITMTVELIKRSDFINEIRDIVKEIVEEVLSEFILEGINIESVTVS